jgi:hypothetical protein
MDPYDLGFLRSKGLGAVGLDRLLFLILFSLGHDCDRRNPSETKILYSDVTQFLRGEAGDQKRKRDVKLRTTNKTVQTRWSQRDTWGCVHPPCVRVYAARALALSGSIL